VRVDLHLTHSQQDGDSYFHEIGQSGLELQRRTKIEIRMNLGTTMKKRNLGTLAIGKKLAYKFPDIIQEIFSYLELLPFQVFDKGTYLYYLGHCPRFEEIPDYNLIPRYELRQGLLVKVPMIQLSILGVGILLRPKKNSIVRRNNKSFFVST
jgi:hypothetical protein